MPHLMLEIKNVNQNQKTCLCALPSYIQLIKDAPNCVLALYYVRKSYKLREQWQVCNSASFYYYIGLLHKFQGWILWQYRLEHA